MGSLLGSQTSLLSTASSSLPGAAPLLNSRSEVGQVMWEGPPLSHLHDHVKISRHLWYLPALSELPTKTVKETHSLPLTPDRHT